MAVRERVALGMSVLAVLSLLAAWHVRSQPVQVALAPSPIWNTIDDPPEDCAIEDRLPSGRCALAQPDRPALGPHGCPIEDRMPSGKCATRLQPADDCPITARLPNGACAKLQPLDDCPITDRLPSGTCARRPSLVPIPAPTPKASGTCPIEDRLPSGGCASVTP